MDGNILRQVEKKLNLKYYATNNSWLKDCVEYYLSEHDNPKDTEVLEFVISQWQLSDMREISNEKPCLPKNLDRETCTTLQGHFILQMEKIYDISESKYKQLEKIRNLSNDNVEVTDAEKVQVAWEPKRTRMLHLQLTDGTQDVIGIEYKPVRFLNDTLLPGYKLLIKGPVTCRRGVIMLDETKIEEIGGEVANLLVPNALENILARALNLPENPDPYGDTEETKIQENDLFDDDFDIDIDDVAVIETDEGREANSIATAEQPPPVSLISRTESDLLFDEIDDIIFDEAEPVIDSPPKLQAPAAFIPQKSHSRGRTKDSAKLTVSPVKLTVSPVKLTGTPVKSTDSPSASSVTIEKNSNIDDIATIPKITTNESKLNPRSSSNVKSNFFPTTDLSRLKLDNANRDSTLSSTKTTDPETSWKKTIQTTPGKKRTAEVLSPPILNSSAEKMHCPKTTNVPKISKNNRKITDYMTKGGDSTSKLSTVTKICEISNASPTDAVVCKIIRGKVTKFDNLSRNGQCWQLNATITDNTGSIDTTFSSEILESMLGFTVAEFSKKRKLKKSDPSMENYLRQGFRSAEKKLSELDDLMEIELAPNTKPKVIKIKSEKD